MYAYIFLFNYLDNFSGIVYSTYSQKKHVRHLLTISEELNTRHLYIYKVNHTIMIISPSNFNKRRPSMKISTENHLY